jgi:hypothetical protein
MKRQLWALLLAAGLGLSSWGTAQSGRGDLLEQKKAQQEIQVMKGILETTMEFVANELYSRESGAGKSETQNSGWKVSRFGGSDISSFYLYGQGVTFIVPISSLRGSFARHGRLAQIGELSDLDLTASLDEASSELAAAGLELAANKEQIELATRQATDAAMQAVLAQTPPPPPPAPVASAGRVSASASSGTGRGQGQGQGQAAAPAKAPRSTGDQEQLRKKLAEAQAKVKKSREEMEAQRQKLLQSISEIKVYLIEALANHGDSLTFLKPSEYINVIITTDEGFPMFLPPGQRSSQREVISILKSVITDYKAGRLNLDGLKQKVMQYTS